MKLPQRILIATDLSEASLRAVEVGAALATSLRADLLLITVLDPVPHAAPVTIPTGPDVWPKILDDAEQTLYAGLEAMRLEKLDGAPCDVAVLRESGAGRAIAGFAKDRGADLIIVGSHGRTGMKRLLLGSVAERVVRLASCSVLVAR